MLSPRWGRMSTRARTGAKTKTPRYLRSETMLEPSITRRNKAKRTVAETAVEGNEDSATQQQEEQQQPMTTSKKKKIKTSRSSGASVANRVVSSSSDTQGGVEQDNIVHLDASDNFDTERASTLAAVVNSNLAGPRHPESVALPLVRVGGEELREKTVPISFLRFLSLWEARQAVIAGRGGQIG